MAKQMKAEVVLGGKLDGSLLKTMATAEKQMALLHKSVGSIHKVAGTAAKVAGVAAVAAGAATAKFVKDSVAAGRNFDSSMAEVAATMGKSVDEIGELREYALEMGKTTMFSASQSADALNYMALAGYDAQTAMSMLPNVLNLAAAGNMELADASDMVTDASSALGLSIEETTKLVDKMAKAASTSNTSVSQLGEAILTVGGTAKSLAGGTTELSTVLGILADNGVKGAEGGTALRNVMTSFADGKFDKVFNGLGVAAYDAEGNMRPLKDIMVDMNGVMSDMTQQERDSLISDAFNARDLKSINALLGTSVERWNELSDAIDSSAGAAQKMAKTKMDNLAGDVTYFKSALEGAQITLSDALTPALREFVQFGTEGLGELTKALSSKEFTDFASGFAEAATSGAKGAYEFLFGVAAVFDEEGNNLIKERVPGMFDGIFEDIDFDGFAEAFTGLGNAIAEALGDGSQAATAKDFGSAIAGAINMAIPVIRAATPLLAGMAGAFKFLADNAEVVVPIIGGIATGLVTIEAVSGVAGVISTIGAALGVIGASGGAAGAGLAATSGGAAAAGAAGGAAAPKLLELGGAVLMIGGGVALAALGVGLLAQSAIALSQADGAPLVLLGIGAGIGILLVAAAALGPALSAASVGILAFGAAVALMGVGVAAACAGISLVIATLAENSAGISEIIGAIGDVFNGAVATIGGAISQIVDAVGGLAESIGGAISGVLDSVAGIFDSIGNAALNAGNGMQAMVDAIGQLVSMDLFAMGASLGSAADGIGKMVSSASGAADAASSMEYLNGLVQSVMNRFAEIGAASSSLQASASGAATAYSFVAVALSSVAAGSPAVAMGFMSVAQGSDSAAAALMAGQVAVMAMVPALVALSGGTTAGEAAFRSFASGVSNAMHSAQSTVASACASMQATVSGMYLTIPPITVSALPHFSMSGSFNPETGSVPTVSVSYYATGGFTDGPIAIAGEAGTEAVISFDPRYRDQNIAYWLMAGQLLGVMEPFALGGFTDGPIAIAGEAGTEAVISFDPRYRDQNIAYWLMAGELLNMINPFAEGGFTDGTASNVSIEIASTGGSLATAASQGRSGGSSGSSINFGGVTFAPQITVSREGKQDVLEQLKSAEEEFFDMLDEWATEREGDYAPVF